MANICVIAVEIFPKFVDFFARENNSVWVKYQFNGVVIYLYFTSQLLIIMQQCILLVDDDKDDCDFLKESLIQVGVRLPVNVVHDGPEAFKFLENLNDNLPQLIILDVNMPLMNGMVILERLSREYKIPVILYTTSFDDNLMNEAKSLRAIDCVKKGTSYSDNLKFAKRVSEFVGRVTHIEY